MKRLLTLLFLPLWLLSGTISAQITSIASKATDTLNQMDAQGNKTGSWVETRGEITFRGSYVKNLKHGNWVGTYPNKIVSSIEAYNMGKKEGATIYIDKRGRITMSENYKNGLRHGFNIVYSQYNDGPATETNYVNGKKNGFYRQFYENGKLQEESFYLDDKKDSISKFNNKSGHLVAEYHYKNGLFEGPQKTFYETDTLQSVMNYRNNEPDGLFRECYPNGKTRIEGNYLKGLQTGTWTEYDETGKATKVSKYKDGKLK